MDTRARTQRRSMSRSTRRGLCRPVTRRYGLSSVSSVVWIQSAGPQQGGGLLIKGRADGRHEGHRVDRGRGRVVAEMHLVMDVWSAGMAAAAADADDVAGVDLLSFVDGRLGELMAVPGDDPAGMVDVDVPAAASGEVGVAVAVAAPVAAG